MLTQIQWKKLLRIFTGIALSIIIMAGIGLYAFVSMLHAPETSKMVMATGQTVATAEAKDSNKTNHRINVLLLGLDDGDPDNPGSPQRSDTMIVASINPEDKTVNLLSIPRDSKTSIPGRQGYDKITEAFFYGGPNLSVRTVETYWGIPIDYYVVLNWNAFIKTVDILGGVDIDVEHDMNYDDPYENLHIHLAKGYQHLNGEKAGEYVRFRHDELGDIGRVKRQQHFLSALTSEMLQTKSILKLPSLIITLSKYIHSDMDVTTMVKLANIIKDMKPNGLHTEIIPGDFATIDDLSYWVPDMDKTHKLVESLFAVAATG
jgi:polyisoprenyl-teichoic acid--peptidoglycan teichoic acid transferase